VQCHDSAHAGTPCNVCSRWRRAVRPSDDASRDRHRCKELVIWGLRISTIREGNETACHASATAARVHRHWCHPCIRSMNAKGRLPKHWSAKAQVVRERASCGARSGTAPPLGGCFARTRPEPETDRHSKGRMVGHASLTRWKSPKSAPGFEQCRRWTEVLDVYAALLALASAVVAEQRGGACAAHCNWRDLTVRAASGCWSRRTP
jgi:hypothetical protein